MRRESLFGPLLLIGAGALFLAREIYPDLRMLRLWPLVLILWGAVRLAERVKA
jgi:hypothetical protein